MEKVKHVDIRKGMNVNDLILEMKKSGVFTAGKLADAADICENMVKDKDCVVFLGLAGAAVPGGMKNVISGLLKEKWFDVFVTTGANLTHDLVEALGHSHYKLNENVSDEELNKKGYDRIYNAVMPNKVYEELEKFFKDKIFPKIDKEISIKELAELVKSMTKSNSEIVYIPYDKAYEEGFEDMQKRIPDLSKIREFIGYKPTTNLKGILEKVIDWAKG